MTWWVAGAMVGGSLLSSSMQSDATEQASQTQANSTAAGIAENRRQFDTTREDYAPFREVGVGALRQVESENSRNPTPAEVMSDPGYQFGLDQGQKALDRKAAAAGGRVSGASLKAASEYGMNYATAGYDKAWARRAERLNRLQALAGIGQTATANTATAGQSSTNAITGLISGQGDATAAGQLARGNIWGNAVNQIAGAGSRYSGGSNNANYNSAGTYQPYYTGTGSGGDYQYG